MQNFHHLTTKLRADQTYPCNDAAPRKTPYPYSRIPAGDYESSMMAGTHSSILVAYALDLTHALPWPSLQLCGLCR